MRWTDPQGGRRYRHGGYGACLIVLVLVGGCGSPAAVPEALFSTVPSTTDRLPDGALQRFPADPGASAQEPLAVAPSAALPTVPPPPDLFAPPQYAGSVTVLFHNEPGNETDIRWRAASTTTAVRRSTPSGIGQFVALRRAGEWD